jgi:hypothetical protein
MIKIWSFFKNKDNVYGVMVVIFIIVFMGLAISYNNGSESFASFAKEKMKMQDQSIHKLWEEINLLKNENYKTNDRLSNYICENRLDKEGCLMR